MIARDRNHLVQFLQSRLTGEYATGRSSEPSGGDAIPVKTYLVEWHPTTDGEADGGGSAEARLRKLLAEPILQVKYPAEVHSASDFGLFTIEGRHRGGAPVHLYADCSDPRFWLIHTLATSETADWIVGRMVAVGTDLARVALPGQHLEWLAGLGSLQGLITLHDRRMFARNGEDADGGDFMSMQLWGARSRRAMSLLQGDSAMSKCLSLSRVYVQYWPDEADDETFCMDDIHCEGRLEARGTSFAAHLRLVDILKDSYRRQVETIESRYRVQAGAEPGMLLGRCLAVRLSRPMGDAARLCRTILSTAPPFRYWGSPTFSSPAFTRARVLDLNLGGLLDFEITPEFVRVFLSAGTSGSAVVRFFATMQRHLDSEARLIGQDGRHVLEFQA